MNPLSRTVPADVARHLRAEAGFGCAVCGCPILEYHHIIPWAEKKHYEMDHMIALCPNHHRELGKQNKKVAYAAKENPINIRNKRFKGYLVTSKEEQALRLGSTRFVNCDTALSYWGVPLFGHKIVEGEIRVKCFVPDSKFFPEIEVVDNNILAMIDGFWDIEFKQNYVKFRRKKGEIFLSMDFRGEDVEIQCRLEIEGKTFRVSKDYMDLNGREISGGAFNGFPNSTAFNYGQPRKRILRPNYAMRVPKAVLDEF